MDPNFDNIAKLVTIAKPIIDPFISVVLKPSIDSLTKTLRKKSIETKITDNFFENKFTDYLSVTLEKCSNVNLLIFQNQQIKLEQIYYPLTVVSSKSDTKYKLDVFNQNLFTKHKKVLISDTAGMGKSTLSKWMSKRAIEERLAIPILIELRNLREDHTLLDEIFFQFNPIDQDFDKELILKFIELGKFLIILDGFDEIQHKSQEAIIKDIRSFVNKANNNWFLLTSRPEGALVAFGDFQSFSVDPLDDKESFKLIEKYDSIAKTKISQNLIKDIQEKHDQVGELLGNPFLVSLLYSTYTYNKDIPANKLSFYDEIYQALYKRHDLSKDGWTRPKHSNLDIQQFRIVLRQLAFDTAILGETNYSETNLSDLVTTSIAKCPGISATPIDIIADLISTVPLFQRDGLKIKWAHKSFQDFFSAEFIAYDSKKELFLESIYKSGFLAFNNILEFIAELDFKTFRKVIVKNLLIDFIHHYENSYLSFDAKRYSKSDLHWRRSKTFGVTHFLISTQNQNNLTNIFTEFQQEDGNKQNANMTTILLNGGGYITVSRAGIKTAIIEIIARQNVDYVIESAYNGFSEIKMQFLKTKRYYVNDDITSVLNSKTNFPKITKSIDIPKILYRNSNRVIIDYEKGKIELQSINMDIEMNADLQAFVNFTTT